MHILMMACSAGDERAPSPYVRPAYGAYSPDRVRFIRLPPTLYDLWVVLADHPNQTVTYATLAGVLWPNAVIADADLVRAHVARLRALLVEVGWPASCLEVVWGRGVVFHAPRA